MKNRMPLALLLLDTLLILGLLVLTVAGAGLYRAALEQQQRHGQQRSALSYIQSQGAVSRSGAAVEGDVLLLPQPDGNYVTRIYLHEGTLRSQLIPADFTPNPENGDVICPMEALRFTWISDGLLHVQTDSGSTYISCLGGGDHG